MSTSRVHWRSASEESNLMLISGRKAAVCFRIGFKRAVVEMREDYDN
jgi:hypothetical protein